MAVKAMDIGIYIYFGLCFLSFMMVLNWTITFHKLQKTNIYLLSRRPWITKLMGIVSCIGLSIERIHAMAFTLSPISTISNHTTIIYWKTTQTLLTHFTLILLQYIFLIRAWLTYYDIKFNQALQDEEWRVQIDPNEATKSWIINHKRTFGNPKYILPFCLSVCSSIGITATVYVGINGDFNLVSRGLIGINALIPMLFNFVIWSKLPVFNDVWRLRREVILCAISQGLEMTIFLIYAAFVHPHPGDWSYLPWNIWGIISYLLMNFIVFQWVFRQFDLPWNILQIKKNGEYQWDMRNAPSIPGQENAEKQQKSIGKFLTVPEEEALHKSTHLNSSRHSNDSFAMKRQKRRDSISNIQSSSAENKDKLSLRGILQNEDGIKLFARHIGREFGLENLLFFIETQQFLDQLHSHPLYGKQIKLLHTAKCGLSVYQGFQDHYYRHHNNSSHNLNLNRPNLSNHASNTPSSSPHGSPIGKDTDLISHPGPGQSGANIIYPPPEIRPQSSSLSYQSISHKSSFMCDNSKYIHLKFPLNIPKSRIMKSGYVSRKEIIHSHTHTQSVSRNNSNNTSKNNYNHNQKQAIHSKYSRSKPNNTPTIDHHTPISDVDGTGDNDGDGTGTGDGRSTGNDTDNDRDRVSDNVPPLPLMNNATGRSNSNTPNLTPQIGSITPYQTPKKSPSNNPLQSTYPHQQTVLQLTALDSDRQYTRDDYQIHERDRDRDISTRDRNVTKSATDSNHNPLTLENHDTGKSISHTPSQGQGIPILDKNTNSSTNTNNIDIQGHVHNYLMQNHSNNNTNTSSSVRKTRSATKSTTMSGTNSGTQTNTHNTITNTITSTISHGSSFPDTNTNLTSKRSHTISKNEQKESEIIQPLEPYDQAVLLYRKYIDNSSPFCINIASQTRKTLESMLGDDKTEYHYDEDRKHYIKTENIVEDYYDNDHFMMNMDHKSDGDNEEEQEQKYHSSSDDIKPDKPSVHDLYHCFDSSRSEIYLLLNQSVQRFKETGAFEEYVNIVIKS